LKAGGGGNGSATTSKMYWGLLSLARQKTATGCREERVNSAERRTRGGVRVVVWGGGGVVWGGLWGGLI